MPRPTLKNLHGKAAPAAFFIIAVAQQKIGTSRSHKRNAPIIIPQLKVDSRVYRFHRINNDRSHRIYIFRTKKFAHLRHPVVDDDGRTYDEVKLFMNVRSVSAVSFPVAMTVSPSINAISSAITWRSFPPSFSKRSQHEHLQCYIWMKTFPHPFCLDLDGSSIENVSVESAWRGPDDELLHVTYSQLQRRPSRSVMVLLDSSKKAIASPTVPISSLSFFQTVLLSI